MVDYSITDTLPLPNSPVRIPRLGFGVYLSSPSVCVQSCLTALQAGYRHIDTAFFYKNEEAIGKALENLIKEGKVKREELFITTKVWSHEHTEELALKSVRRSLEKLKLTYVDLVLIHWPQSFQPGGEPIPKANGKIIGANRTEANFELGFKGLEKAVELNLTRSIGVSNFNVKQMEKVISVASIKPVLNQVECHPHLSQQELLDFCTQNGVRLEAYSPLRRGDRTLFENTTLKDLATKHNRTVAQVALRWQIQRGVIVIPKSSKSKRMIENKDIFGFSLTPEDMSAINALNSNDRMIKFEDSAHLAQYPF